MFQPPFPTKSSSVTALPTMPRRVFKVTGSGSIGPLIVRRRSGSALAFAIARSSAATMPRSSKSRTVPLALASSPPAMRRLSKRRSPLSGPLVTKLKRPGRLSTATMRSRSKSETSVAALVRLQPSLQADVRKRSEARGEDYRPVGAAGQIDPDRPGAASNVEPGNAGAGSAGRRSPKAQRRPQLCCAQPFCELAGLFGHMRRELRYQCSDAGELAASRSTVTLPRGVGVAVSTRPRASNAAPPNSATARRSI